MTASLTHLATALRLLSVAALTLLAAGCYGRPVASPEQLDALGTRQYPDYSVDEVREAVEVGLRLDGYRIVATEPLIRTEPKLVSVTASATGSYGVATAQSYGEEVAWDIKVSESDGVATVEAQHRATVNGMAMDQVYLSWAESNYARLFDLIESSLPESSSGGEASGSPPDSGPSSDESGSGDSDADPIDGVDASEIDSRE